ncbi:hypothetical protein BGW38_002884 [Lunasporangiospora selenospora]|uniref:Glucosidase 2 subunit beta n=1 Tax=Lunasporangiospora selenospora TaxID=979761 RepID=A0A9P6KCL1_9FUNG|nr:hypothetical protein BGW38_002884 [Lunasporangiospora selenospora]
MLIVSSNLLFTWTLGTSACGTGYFYCANVGHRPAFVRSSRVNDGICDPECCDGSDEYSGVGEACPNICAEAGLTAKKEHERLLRIKKQGAKLRQGYVDYGKNLKKDLKLRLEELKANSEASVKLSQETKDELDKVIQKEQEYKQQTQSEREEARKRQLEPLIEKQLERRDIAQAAATRFQKTLEDLKDNHNKNFHDMAVKSTISGFDEWVADKSKEAELNPESKVESEGTLSPDQRLIAAQDEAYEYRKDIGALFQLLKTMKEEYNHEYNDPAVLSAVAILDEFAPTWDGDVNEFLNEETIEAPEETKDETPEAQKLLSETELAQEKHNTALSADTDLQNEIRDIERKLAVDYGKDETFAHFVDKCFEYKDHESFSNWVGDSYNTQMYTGGAKCWNGPERSVKLEMTCGVENEITSVTEPEKCEYLYQFTTPAACPLLSEIEAQEKAEAEVVPEIPPPEEKNNKGSQAGGNKKHDEL